MWDEIGNRSHKATTKIRSSTPAIYELKSSLIDTANSGEETIAEELPDFTVEDLEAEEPTTRKDQQLPNTDPVKTQAALTIQKCWRGHQVVVSVTCYLRLACQKRKVQQLLKTRKHQFQVALKSQDKLKHGKIKHEPKVNID